MKSKLKLHPDIFKLFWIIVVLSTFFTACRVTFISGYDPLIDGTATKIKRDFNLHFIKLQRTLQDTDPENQKFENFLEYYDNLEVDLMVVKDRTQFLESKSTQVKKQVSNLDSAMRVFIKIHKAGMADSQIDDRRDIKNAINSSIDAVIRLQEELRTTGTINNKNQ
ncbi:hypothetical protein [Daejeonella oryzae]|uniref:hypothetical protein n=1 Tax=Daejeonella oryzae TaxID=1122943 RepID=UPI0003FA140A|nr:hypothetical protein [Daejeonella oryzae]